ncbi:MAG: efflux RND transporter periplasmic adaptor subunit [Calditrichia bacterium]
MIKKLFFCLLAALLFSCSGGDEEYRFSGIIEGTVVQVPALTGGEITGFYVDTGEQVDSSALIARTDTVQLHFQKQELQGAFAEVQAQRSLARTRLQQAREDRRYVQEKYGRFQTLQQKQSVAQQTVDDLRNRLQSAESAVQSANQQFRTLDAKSQQLQARLAALRQKLQDAEVRSPVAGLVSATYFETGEAVPPMGAVAEITDISEVWVKIYVPEEMLPDIKAGESARILPDGSERELHGRISWISPQAEFTPKTVLTPETRTSLVYAVKITIDNEEGLLKHGMPVAVALDKPETAE